MLLHRSSAASLLPLQTQLRSIKLAGTVLDGRAMRVSRVAIALVPCPVHGRRSRRATDIKASVVNAPADPASQAVVVPLDVYKVQLF